MTDFEKCIGSKGLLTQFEKINGEFAKLLSDYCGLHIVTVNGRGYVVLTEELTVVDKLNKSTTAKKYFKKNYTGKGKCLWFDYNDSIDNWYSLKVQVLEKK